MLWLIPNCVELSYTTTSPGVVHASVGRKLLKSILLQVIASFHLMADYKFSTLRLKKSRLDRNHSSVCYFTSLIPPINNILTLVKPFSFV
jgi:hypothetical protein